MTASIRGSVQSPAIPAGPIAEGRQFSFSLTIRDDSAIPYEGWIAFGTSDAEPPTTFADLAHVQTNGVGIFPFRWDARLQVLTLSGLYNALPGATFPAEVWAAYFAQADQPAGVDPISAAFDLGALHTVTG